MSLKSWKEEFYPIEADDVAPEDALAHSLKKWEGLTEENLAKHGVQQYTNRLKDDNSFFSITGESCALCHIYYKCSTGCDGCPLYVIRGNVSCDLTTAEEDCSPYISFEHDGDPQPMIDLIRRAVKEFKK